MMVMKSKDKTLARTGITESRPWIDLNKSRRAAQDAMDKMRKNRVKRGRVILSRGIIVSDDNRRP